MMSFWYTYSVLVSIPTLDCSAFAREALSFELLNS